MDIKRTILWVIFSFSLLMLWDGWMRHNRTTTPPQATAQQASATPDGALPTPTAAPAATDNVVSAQAPEAKGEVITITTDVVKADIDTAGGQLVRLELLKNKDAEHPEKNVVLFNRDEGHTYLAQTGLIRGDFPTHRTVFSALPGVRTLENGDKVELTMQAEVNGVKLAKTFVFKRGDYVIDLRQTVTNDSAAVISPDMYLRLLRDGTKPNSDSPFYSTFTGPAVYTEADKFQKLKFEDIADGKATYAKSANNGWTALIQHYFVSAFIPQDKAVRQLDAKVAGPNLYALDTILPLGNIAPGASVTTDVRLYSGPQESRILEHTAPGLELVKDYGIFTIIAKPIFWLLEHIHAVVGNWGWSIILLTVLIKLVFFPLSAASYRSMAKMKTVAPRIQAIRERHKGDQQKVNQEMMQLYKTEKINPLGGCLPMLIQIPVFISLYWVLLASVEMRNAPWILWIHDLAAKDPYFILPVIMAVSMFVQVKLNPAPPDPIQAKVMMFMPIVFSVMFFFFPSGLVLYWVVNNILSIAQQWVITKKIATGTK